METYLNRPLREEEKVTRAEFHSKREKRNFHKFNLAPGGRYGDIFSFRFNFTITEIQSDVIPVRIQLARCYRHTRREGHL